MNRLLSLSLATALTLGSATIASAGPVTVSGNYIQLGVSDSGVLIDFSSQVGIKYDPSGTGHFDSAIDFLNPLFPFAYYAVSLGAMGLVNSTTGGLDMNGNPFGATTLNGSGAEGNPYMVSTQGTFQGLTITQVLFFNRSSQSIHANVTFANLGAADVKDVAYSVGFDPSQDYSKGAISTNNTINGQGSNASVTAYGSASQYSITLANTSGWNDTLASIENQGTQVPHLQLLAPFDLGDGDHTINLSYKLGDFTVGQEKSIGYNDTMSAMMVPEPEIFAMMLLGLAVLGVKGRKAKNETFR